MSGVAGAVVHAERLRERRLLREEQRERLIDAEIPIDAVAAADDERRTEQRPPGHRDARLEAALVRTDERRRIRRARERPTGLVARTGLTAVKSGATSRLARRPDASVNGASYSQRTPRFSVRPGSRPPVVGRDTASDDVVAQTRRRVAERDRAGRGHAEQEVGERVAGGRAGERQRAARIRLRRDVHPIPANVAAGRDVVRPSLERRLDAAGLCVVRRLLILRRR